MKTQWCARLQYLALVGVLLLGMTVSSVYAQVGGSNVVDEIQVAPEDMTLPLRIAIGNLDDELAIYLNGQKVFHRTILAGRNVTDEVDLTGLLIPGRNSLTFVGVNWEEEWFFDVSVFLGDAVVARYLPRTGTTAIPGLVWDATLLIER
jgi:hypothetical protein